MAQAARDQAIAEAQQQQDEILEAAMQINAPIKRPAWCGYKVKSDVQPGDRLDVATLKLDHALTKANTRIVYCAKWHDTIQEGTAIPKKP